MIIGLGKKSIKNTEIKYIYIYIRGKKRKKKKKKEKRKRKRKKKLSAETVQRPVWFP